MPRLCYGGGGGYPKPRCEGCREKSRGVSLLSPPFRWPAPRFLVLCTEPLRMGERGHGAGSGGTPSPGPRDLPCSCFLETRGHASCTARAVSGALPSLQQFRTAGRKPEGVEPGQRPKRTPGELGRALSSAGSEKLDVGQGLGFRAWSQRGPRGMNTVPADRAGRPEASPRLAGPARGKPSSLTGAGAEWAQGTRAALTVPWKRVPHSAWGLTLARPST